MTVNDIIDLTDDLTDEPSSSRKLVNISVSEKLSHNGEHSASAAASLLINRLAELPEYPFTPKYEHVAPPQPQLGICKAAGTNCLTLAWHVNIGTSTEKEEETPAPQIKTYELWMLRNLEWKKVGDIKALPPPMSCTLSQIQTGVVYVFIIRAIDVDGHIGPFSLPCNFTI